MIDLEKYLIGALGLLSKRGVYRAFLEWNGERLIELERAVREEIVKVLIKQTERLGLKPRDVWLQALRSPEVFEEWRKRVILDDQVMNWLPSFHGSETKPEKMS